MKDARSCFEFDPSLCPLLQGLPPEEQQLLMRTDPMIRACIEMHSAQGTGDDAIAPTACCQASRQVERGDERTADPMIGINKQALS
jgi:hypothetical protein